MESVKERVSRHLLMDDRLEAIALVEDEIDDIVERIYKSKAILPQDTMVGNASMYGKKGKGYLVKMDNGEVIYLQGKSYKGFCIEKGTRLQCGIIKETSNNRKICVDAMECLPYDELKYLMFSHIEQYDMFRASSYAWALYDKAQERDKEEMKYCIHALRNYIKKINN